ncbi:MAG: polyhydroxyalkanoate depolymerase [Proteobacteria bacterium]|nr:polyhydroxyalkanoate depolymerase [Pseudomonadota bacterium]
MLRPRRGSVAYACYQSHADMMWPLRTLAKTALPALRGASGAAAEDKAMRKLAAACEVFVLAALTHERPPFRIPIVTVGDADYAVHEEVAHRTPFGTLLHFRKEMADPGPRVLIVAPLSGHFATLLRDTVRVMLADHDVYITDWHNAREVPLAAGRFGLDEYTEHIMQFLGVMGPGSHLMAICQPCVSALSAVALMSEDGHPATPASLTLMAGPIDCRISPTEVNQLATEKPMSWFRDNLITTVPLRYPGALRSVYPGFLQLMAFMSMNLDRHLDSFRGLFNDLVNGDTDKADATKAFYEEYLAVCDLPAEFYLETVKRVFQDYDLPQGRLTWRGRRIDPGAIRRTALLTVEGERDDICSLGQTLAAHELCSNLRPYLRTHYVQAGAGHYGVFSGRRWSGSIYPLVREIIHQSQP